MNAHDKYTSPELSLSLKEAGVLQEAGDCLYWVWEGKSKKPYLLDLANSEGSKKILAGWIDHWHPKKKLVLARVFRLDELIDEILRLSPKEHIYFNRVDNTCKTYRRKDHWSCYLAWSLPDEVCGLTPADAVGKAVLELLNLKGGA